MAPIHSFFLRNNDNRWEPKRGSTVLFTYILLCANHLLLPYLQKISSVMPPPPSPLLFKSLNRQRFGSEPLEVPCQPYGLPLPPPFFRSHPCRSLKGSQIPLQFATFFPFTWSTFQQSQIMISCHEWRTLSKCQNLLSAVYLSQERAFYFDYGKNKRVVFFHHLLFVLSLVFFKQRFSDERGLASLP